MLQMKSTSTIFFFKQQNLDSGEAISIFLTFHLFIFFCSSSSLKGCVFNWRLQTHSCYIFLWFFLFLSKPFFFLVFQPNWYGSLCFFERSDGFFCSSYFSGISKVEMKSTTTYIFLNHQKIESGDSLSIFLSFL